MKQRTKVRSNQEIKDSADLKNGLGDPKQVNMIMLQKQMTHLNVGTTY
jgi:hypothetical protein